MKRTLLSIFFVAGAIALYAAQPATGVTGTFHDLSSTGYHKDTALAQVCVFCHIPHGAAGSGWASGNPEQLIPLWNHATSVATFHMYGGTNDVNAEMVATPGVAPSAESLACLSCHDGTVAVGSLVNNPYGWGSATNYSTYTGTWFSNTTGLMLPGTPTFIGTDLSNDHPISIQYLDTNALLTGQLVAAASIQKARLFPTNATGNYVQCASCHDPHNYGVSQVNSPFLRDTMVGSKLCLDCHIK